MGGYRYQKTTYRLIFDEPEFEGLEIVVKQVGFSQYMEIMRLLNVDDTGSFRMNAAVTDQLIDLFVPLIKSWNLLDDDDRPVPLTADALREQDLGFTQRVILAYAETVSVVRRPLAPPSPDGALSEVESLPMEVLSASPSS